MKYAFTHCGLIDGTKDMVLQPDMTVIVEDETIKAIQPADATIGSDVVEINLSGKYLMPGLINAHVHLFGTGKASKTLSGGSAQRMILKFAATKAGHAYLDSMAAKNVRNALHSGVTTIRTVGDFHHADIRTRDKVSNGTLEGPRMFVSGPAITVTNGHGDGTFAVIADGPWALRSLVRTNVKNGVDWIKICITGGVMDSKKKGEAGVLRMTSEEAKAICEEAHKNGFKVASHTEGPEGMRVCMEAGVDTIEHGAEMDADVIDGFKANGSAVICTISPALPLAKLSTDLTLLSPVAAFNSEVILERVIKGAKTALDNGIPVGLGTDTACPFVAHYDMWRELVYFKNYVGVSRAFAIYSATLQNAKILGVDDITGSIETGKCADMIVMEKNPLDDLTALRNVTMVMHRGKLIDKPMVEHIPAIDENLDTLLPAG